MNGKPDHQLVMTGCVAMLLVLPMLSCGQRDATDAIEPPVPAVTTPYDPLEAGREHYVQYCASCHGADGRGSGPVADALKDAPTDLTRFRMEHGGSFDVDEMIEIIRGRRDVRAHGTREMPVWGNIWVDNELRRATPEQVETRMNELVEYLRSIQQ